MIQPTYISERKCGNKWYPMDDAPVPLLRTNYLSEFRTEIEKAQARKNLGIPDEMQMKWGGMSGYVEEQRDLIEYMELKWKYTTELSEDITTVAEALDYIMKLITTYTDQNGEVSNIKKELETINKDIEDTNALLKSTEEALQKNIDTNSENITALEESITNINSAIDKLNQDLININVDSNILAWIKAHLSDTIELQEGDKLAVKISATEGNAVQNKDGLYVIDNSTEIKSHTKDISDLQRAQESIQTTVDKHQESIDAIKDSIDIAIGYDTELDDAVKAPETVGGIPAGTTVKDLKGKTLIEIVDIMLFPTTVRDLVYPSLSYRPSYQLIEVGSMFSKPVLTFTQNDAGVENNRVEKVTLNGIEIEISAYDQLGTYKYTATVSYDAGEYLKDSKGEITNKRVEAGSLTATATYITTYPWYAGNKTNVSKQALVAFGSASGDKTITMGRQACVKLPGNGSKINSFTVDGGLGYTAVNLAGWTESTEELNGITYKVWTKNDEYQSDLSHKINFTLAL